MTANHQLMDAAEAPRLSCVIPAYNNLDLFSRALVSALSQRDCTFEVVVSDDSTAGDVRDFTRALAAFDPRVRWVEGARCGNPVANWNNGLANARGDYVIVLHHDEFIVSSTYFKDAVAALDASDSPAIVARSAIVTLSGSSRFATVQRIATRLGFPLWTLNAVNWIGSTACVCFRRGPRFNENLVNTVDAEFYNRVFASRRPRFLTDTRVVSIARHEQQITTTLDVPKSSLDEITTVLNTSLPTFPRALLQVFWSVRLMRNRVFGRSGA